MVKTRKELKEEYKLIKPRIGVFQIRNLKNGKVFISSTLNLDKVWNSQKFQLEAGGHTNPLLQKEWNEFAADNFVYEILHELKVPDDESFDARKEIKTLEDMVIEEVQPFGEKGYNKISTRGLTNINR